MPKLDYAEMGAITGFSHEWESVVLYTKAAPDMKGRLAIELVEKWGMVAAVEDGEDSAGRQKVKLQTPVALVARACETADLLIDEIRKRGWVTEFPAPVRKEG